MKIFHKRVVMDIKTGVVLQRDSFAYEGPIAEAKGESKAAARAAEQQRQEQNQLMREQLAMQRGVLGKVTGGVEQFLTPEGVGFDPATMAALNAQAIESVPGQFEDARQQLMRSLLARGGAGGELPVGGDFLRNLAQLNVGRESLKTNLLRENIVKNALLKLQNRFQAANSLLGVGGEYNPSPFISGASSALGARVSAAQSADQSGLWNNLVGSFGQSLGGALGRGVGAGIGGIFGGCWVASELYGGWYSPRTIAIREWLGRGEGWMVRLFAAVYLHLGKRWALLIRGHRILRAVTRLIFDSFPVGGGG